jgi:ATP-binding cassette subfamily C (CFTR/MRP) protein 1
VVTFGVFVAIAAARHDRSILTAQAFTSLSLISLQTTPALTLIQNIPSVVQCLSCFGRIQEYCVRSDGQGFFDIEPKSKEPPSKHGREKATEMGVLQNTKRDVKNSQPSHIVSFSRESFGWSKSGPTVLNHLDIQIMDSRITIILGPVGSGKSTLLESILGETVALDGKGRTDRNFSTAAYCSQVPWLMNGTIRDNIIGQPGKYSVDEEWYSSVLWACGLETDLRGFKEGDNVVVGSKGSSLSGGQKQRVVSCFFSH